MVFIITKNEVVRTFFVLYILRNTIEMQNVLLLLLQTAKINQKYCNITAELPE